MYLANIRFFLKFKKNPVIREILMMRGTRKYISSALIIKSIKSTVS
jgi:hypothetical protein